jgi:hypothetical protein
MQQLLNKLFYSVVRSHILDLYLSIGHLERLHSCSNLLTDVRQVLVHMNISLEKQSENKCLYLGIKS